jgi:hypothetical protein
MKASLACILTSTTGVQFVKDFNEFKKFLGDFCRVGRVETIACGSLRDAAKPQLLAQLPFLKRINVENVTPKNVWQVLAELEAKYGASHTVKPL